MRCLKIFLPFICLLVCPALYAQQQKAVAVRPTASQPIKDTFAFNLLSTLDKVIRFAEDTKQSAWTLAGDLLRTDNKGAGIYQPAIQLPHATAMSYKLSATYRMRKETNWEWRATLLDLPKGQGATAITTLKNKVDSLLPNITKNIKTEGVKIYVQHNFDISYREADQLWVSVSFYKGLYNTEQAVIDSLQQLYKPLMLDKRIAAACAEKFGEAMKLEDIPGDTYKKITADAIIDLANKNAEAAYQALLGIPYPADYMVIFEQVPAGPKEIMRSLAKQDVQKYNDEQNAKFNKSKPDVVVEQKKEIEKNKAPSDPCKREIWELRLKPGYYVEGDGRIAYIRDYSCIDHTYTISWVNSTNKLITEKKVTVDGMSAYRFSSASPFSVCSNCNGVGFFMEHDWVQMGVGSNYYARSNKQSQVSCGVCRGAGFIRIR